MSLLAEIRDLVLRHAERGRLLPGLGMGVSHAPTEPIPAVSGPVFALVVQGAKRTVLAGTTFEYGAGQYIVISVDLPITAHVVQAGRAEPYLMVGLTLAPTEIAGLLLEGPGTGRTPAAGRGIAVSTATDDLLDPVVRLLRLLDRPQDAPVLAAAYRLEILWRLITGEQGALVRQIGLADSRLTQIARATHWIRDNYADLFRIEDVARVAGMSVTSFHRHFRSITAMTPLQYQKQIRLQEARTRLIADPHDVTAVAFAVGYESASQFSREYRRMFGLPPGRDAQRLHALPAAAHATV